LVRQILRELGIYDSNVLASLNTKILPPLLASLSVQEAVHDCVRKHKAASAAMYGALGYMLLLPVAADKFGVLAMRVDGTGTYETVVDPFLVSFRV
jgi:hypothetical protein